MGDQDGCRRRIGEQALREAFDTCGAAIVGDDDLSLGPGVTQGLPHGVGQELAGDEDDGERHINTSYSKPFALSLSKGRSFFWAPHFDKLSTNGKRGRSEEHTSELQSLMRISYAVFCLKKKNTTQIKQYKHTQQWKLK